ncbi:MAG: cyclic nucleotide-binding domain-containing protein [Deltaproteobacteria bacterium]|nr:cyclic nucleotide-binding domain-containing protein [Deltaproteobacteria bacterium]
MEGEPRFRRPHTPLGTFKATGERENTKRARALARPETEPVPAHELARIHDADELGVELHITGDVPLLPDEVFDPESVGVEFHRTGKFDAFQPEPVEIPLTSTRSLIPQDILEAIAREEEELLEAEALAEEEADADYYEDDEGEHLALDDDELEVVSEHADEAEAMAALQRAKVLQDFASEALQTLVPGVVRHHLVNRQPAFREGAGAESFFVVESGVMEVVCSGPDGEVALLHVRDNEPFGLFGLLTRKVRTATVRAIGEASVLEFRAARLDAAARGYPSVRQALARYFKERLLESFLAASPLFRNLDAVGRAALISHFEDRKVAAGEVLLSPGEVQNGIALITSGRVVVSRRDSPGKDKTLADLSRGRYYGVVSALAGLPTRASIWAPEPTTLCYLPQKAFNEFVHGYPVLRTLPSRLDEAGEKVERDVFVGDATDLG